MITMATDRSCSSVGDPGAAAYPSLLSTAWPDNQAALLQALSAAVLAYSLDISLARIELNNSSGSRRLNQYIMVVLGPTRYLCLGSSQVAA